MQDKLVGVEVAKLAKDKGFDEVCYYLHHVKFEEYEAVENGKFHKNSKINIKLHKGDFVTAPSQGLVQAWLRDNHNIFIEVQTDCTTAPKFCFEIKQFIGNPRDLASEDWDWSMIPNDDTWGLYRKYEEALEEGLKKGLNLIK
jgi:hypothetical protein